MYTYFLTYYLIHGAIPNLDPLFHRSPTPRRGPAPRAAALAPRGALRQLRQRLRRAPPRPGRGALGARQRPPGAAGGSLGEKREGNEKKVGKMWRKWAQLETFDGFWWVNCGFGMGFGVVNDELLDSLFLEHLGRKSESVIFYWFLRISRKLFSQDWGILSKGARDVVCLIHPIIMSFFQAATVIVWATMWGSPVMLVGL